MSLFQNSNNNWIIIFLINRIKSNYSSLAWHTMKSLIIGIKKTFLHIANNKRYQSKKMLWRVGGTNIKNKYSSKINHTYFFIILFIHIFLFYSLKKFNLIFFLVKFFVFNQKLYVYIFFLYFIKLEAFLET